jgi:hypothetical protein
MGIYGAGARRWLAGILLWVGAACGESNLPTKDEVRQMMNGLSSITGFQVRKQLPFQLVTREEVNKYLKDQIQRSVKPSELRAEEATLKKFGFVPPDFDLKSTTIELLTEQAAAFYDFHRKKLFISDWATRNMRETALVHELAHALADQNFPIRKFLSKGGDDSEASQARESVVEGQASWLMIEFAARQAGRTLKDPDTANEFLKDQSDSDDGAYPVFSKAPLYIRRTLMFPYEDGQKFQQAVFLKEGMAAFAKVFEKAPVSTSQVIHPDRYFAGVVSTAPELPKPVRHSKVFVGGTVGELDQRILLQQYVDTGAAEALAPRMRGGAYRIDEMGGDHRLTLVYVSEWEDEKAAGQYFSAYQRVLRGKWKQVDVTLQDATKFSGKSEDGYFSVELKGTKVQSAEGFAEPVSAGSGA